VNLKAHDLDEINIEIIRNSLYRAYIEDFHQFCQQLDSNTASAMGEILQVRRDYQIISIIRNE
jgi:V-type H+-transporting ATPase subunit d